MKNANSHEPHSALSSFQHLGSAGKPASAAIRELLKSDRQATRQAAALALAYIGDSSPEAAAILSASLGGRVDGTETQIIYALGKMGAASKAAVPALCLWLGPAVRLPHNRLSVVSTLGQIGPDAAPAVPLLLPLLRGNDQQLRLATARALAKIDKKRLPEVVAALIDDLGVDPPGYFNSTAARALGEIGPDANDAVPALLSLLNHSYAMVRVEAARALHFIDSGHDARVVEVLLAILEQEKELPVPPYAPGTMFGEGGPQYPRAGAVVALGEIGPAAKPALPKLKELAKSKDWLVRKAAAEAINKIEQ
jgi:HEAT repeat protein